MLYREAHMLVLQNSDKVILIFSVNMSGFFQGYAQMMSAVGWRRDNIWSKGCGKINPWGCSFKVKWLRLNDLPFQKTLHLKNPLNDFKPVKISRDCQVSLSLQGAFLPFKHFENSFMTDSCIEGITGRCRRRSLWAD